MVPVVGGDDVDELVCVDNVSVVVVVVVVVVVAVAVVVDVADGCTVVSCGAASLSVAVAGGKFFFRNAAISLSTRLLV